MPTAPWHEFPPRPPASNYPRRGPDAYYGIGGVLPVWEFIAVTLPRELTDCMGRG
jgi:hypothetical protein